MEEIKKNVPAGGVIVTFFVLLTLLITKTFDWGTFLASLPGLVVVYNTLAAIMKPDSVRVTKTLEPYQNLEYKAISKVKSIFK